MAICKILNQRSETRLCNQILSLVGERDVRLCLIYWISVFCFDLVNGLLINNKEYARIQRDHCPSLIVWVRGPCRGAASLVR
jgi:hypothetical protein